MNFQSHIYFRPDVVGHGSKERLRQMTLVTKDNVELVAAALSQHKHRFGRRLKFLFTGRINTATCPVCKEYAERALRELVQLQPVADSDKH